MRSHHGLELVLQELLRNEIIKAISFSTSNNKPLRMHSGECKARKKYFEKAEPV